MNRTDTNPVLCTLSGIEFHPFHPTPDEIDIRDIAHGLAHHCRFNGQCSDFYSVAQHSAIMANWAYSHGQPGVARWCLMHDAAEAYLPDLCRPIKDGMGWSMAEGGFSFISFAVIESRILRAIAERFTLLLPMPELVGALDNRMLATEKRDLGFAAAEWPNLPDPFEDRVYALNPLYAERVFLDCFKLLFGGES
jgi:uncharacterized protein